MTFSAGKYKGRRVEDVPSSYLIWSLENGYWRNYAGAMREELLFRLGFHAAADVPSSRPVIPHDLQDSAVDVIEAGFRALALKRHPDQGGDALAMRKLIEVRTMLKAVARG